MEPGLGGPGDIAPDDGPLDTPTPQWSRGSVAPETPEISHPQRLGCMPQWSRGSVAPETGGDLRRPVLLQVASMEPGLGGPGDPGVT